MREKIFLLTSGRFDSPSKSIVRQFALVRFLARPHHLACSRFEQFVLMERDGETNKITECEQEASARNLHAGVMKGSVVESTRYKDAFGTTALHRRTSRSLVATCTTSDQCKLTVDNGGLHVRNFVSLGVIAPIDCLIKLAYTFSRSSLPPNIVYPLLVVALVVSTWANFQLGLRIGWKQGGLPVVFILVAGWAVVYVMTCLVAAGAVYWLLDPDRLLH